MSEADPEDFPPQASGEYYAQAQTWAVDREQALRRSSRTAWIVAAVAATLAVLEGLALVALAPLKTVVPYTVMVDRTTGFVQVLEGTHPQTVKPQSALTNSMLAQYVIARESFDINGIAAQYNKVALWSGEAARRDYLALMPIGNPMSPMNLYPRSAQVTTTVESVTSTGQDTAQVRFVIERRDQPQGAVSRAWYAAQIRYRFTGEPMSLEDRLANPLGFQVIEYRRDQEAAPQQAANSAAVPGAAVVAPAAGAMQPAYVVPVGPRGVAPPQVRQQGGM